MSPIAKSCVNSKGHSLRIACFSSLAMLAILHAGCLGLASNLMHAVGVDMIPAEFTGLEENTVAVVVVTESSHYANDPSARELSRRVGAILTQKVDDLQLVREDKIEQFRDVHGLDADFESIGEGVGATKVVGIELSNLSLQEGATLYRGRSDVTIQVIDVETGNIDYTRSLDEFTYPNLAGQYTSETTETHFRKLYLGMLAEEIGRSFHPYDMTDRIAADSIIASH